MSETPRYVSERADERTGGQVTGGPAEEAVEAARPGGSARRIDQPDAKELADEEAAPEQEPEGSELVGRGGDNELEGNPSGRPPRNGSGTGPPRRRGSTRSCPGDRTRTRRERGTRTDGAARRPDVATVHRPGHRRIAPPGVPVLASGSGRPVPGWEKAGRPVPGVARGA
nr:hypothetical protein GCM10020093_084790 [Planobispora longispora]